MQLKDKAKKILEKTWITDEQKKQQIMELLEIAQQEIDDLQRKIDLADMQFESRVKTLARMMARELILQAGGNSEKLEELLK